ncbi:hypothetical protein PaG_03424 [Moesziomyces aphidis]|uniref:Uncharacterized protein n=1 Tax=Moesziomyces aphidis TaxID=84754 RepID=W3VNJ2_MOEAP|nr:hypothetical protein PaG_03424 [Moesziomyces aphidis]
MDNSNPAKLNTRSAVDFASNILGPARERDRILFTGKFFRAEIETGVAELADKTFPTQGGGSVEEMTAIHDRLMDEVIIPLTDKAITVAKEVTLAKEEHAYFHSSLRKMYLQPPGDRTTGPFTLKRERREEDHLPKVHEFHLTIRQDNLCRLSFVLQTPARTIYDP